jgi:hypothetical protein
MSRKKAFVKLYEEYGAPVIDRVLSVLGDGAAEAEVRTAAKRIATSEKKPARKVVAKKVEAPALVKSVSGAAKRRPSKAQYSREELAKRYPKTAPPELKVDKRTGKEFLSKSESPEAAALREERSRVVDEMRTEGYAPFFNPEERFYADPSRYALEGNTLDIRPKRPDTVAKYEALANDPDALDRLSRAYEIGSEHPGAKEWYATGQLERAYLDALGPEEGAAMYKRRFADAMSATTGGMDPDANFRLASYMNYLDAAGLDSPTASYELPYPIGGGKYGVMPNVNQYQRLIRDGEGITVANPKRFNFSGDFLGDTQRATLDEQMMSGWDPKMQMPPPGSYGTYEEALGRLADKFGVPPAEAQDVMWAGIKLPKEAGYTPRPMIDIVNDAIERTSRLTGLSPEEVMDGIIRGDVPVYAEGGAVTSSF